jgi:hypothetical protein
MDVFPYVLTIEPQAAACVSHYTVGTLEALKRLLPAAEKPSEDDEVAN